MRKDNKAFGAWGEEQAVQYLISQDYIILERNFRCQSGEIDIIAYNNSRILFIEVKTRSSNYYGTPGEAVGYKKQQKYVQAALYYIKKNGNQHQSYQFDIIEVMAPKTGTVNINHIPNAFQSNVSSYRF